MAYSRAPVVVNLTDTIEEMRAEVNALTAKLNELFDGSNNFVTGGASKPALITSPVLAGSITGTYTLAGTPTITNPTINAATITGTVASTGTVTFSQRDIHTLGITVANGQTIGSASDADAITIASAGAVTFSQRDVHTLGITIANGTEIGSAGDPNAITIATAGAVTFSQRDVHTLGITIANGTEIGSAGDPNAITISSGGVVAITATTANTSASDGALTVAGGVGIAADATIGDDLRLISDDSILSFGVNSDVALTHVHNDGLILKNTGANTTVLTIQSSDTDVADGNILGEIDFQAPSEGAGTDAILVAASIAARSEGDFSATNNATELVFNTGATEDASTASSGGKMILSSAGTLNVTGGFGQGVLSKSANYTILSTDANIFLVTTSTGSITMTLPAASAVPGKVYRFMKVDSGGVGSGDAKTGIVIIARAGSDTIGINANLTMELWFQDNYVDLMSDGTSRWLVVGTEMFNEPIVHRTTGSGNPNGATTLGAADGSSAWNELNYSTGDQEVPAGTSHIKMFIVMYMPGDGTTHNANLYFRPKGSTRAVSTPLIAFGIQHEDMPSGDSLRADGYLLLECDIARKIEYYMIRDQGTSAISFYMHTHGYRLG